MNNFLKILVLPLVSIILAVSPSLGQEETNEAAVSVSRSTNSPVQITLKGIARYDEAKWQAQDYLRNEYESYFIWAFSYHLPKDDNDVYTESFYLRNDEGHEITVSFDMTDVYKARAKKFNKEFNKKLKEKEAERKRADKQDEKRLSSLRKKFDEVSPIIEKIMAEEFKKLGKPAQELTKEEWEKLHELYNKLLKEKLKKGSSKKEAGK